MSLIERIKHLPSTIEGTVWGVAIVALGTYTLHSFNCDLSNVEWWPWILGAIAVVRGAIAGGSKVAAPAVDAK